MQATGQGAVELSGQTEVANVPLREALEMAANLPLAGFEEMLAQAAEEAALAQAQAGQPLPAEDAPPGDAQPGQGQPMPTPGQGQPMPTPGGQPQQGSPSQSGQPQPGQPQELGTGFVPKSPQLTAQMMAGAKAQQAMQQAMAQGAPPVPGQPSQANPQGQPTPSQAQEGQPLPGQPSNSSKIAKKDGQATTNQKVKDGAVQKEQEGTDAGDNKSNKGRDKEDNILARQLKDEAWFAKLPPELRKSIRAGVGQKPPRAYEERLKKYFESVD
jgi:hypothetical protein